MGTKQLAATNLTHIMCTLLSLDLSFSPVLLFVHLACNKCLESQVGVLVSKSFQLTSETEVFILSVSDTHFSCFFVEKVVAS